MIRQWKNKWSSISVFLALWGVEGKRKFSNPEGRWGNERCGMLKTVIKIRKGLINNFLVLPTVKTTDFNSDRLLLWAQTLRDESQDGFSWWGKKRNWKKGESASKTNVVFYSCGWCQTSSPRNYDEKL